MQSQCLRKSDSKTHQAPCNAGVHVIRDDVPEDQKRLYVLDVGVRKEVGESEAFEAAAYVDLRSKLSFSPRQCRTLASRGQNGKDQSNPMQVLPVDLLVRHPSATL